MESTGEKKGLAFCNMYPQKKKDFSTKPPTLLLWNGTFLSELRTRLFIHDDLPPHIRVPLQHLIKKSDNDFKEIEKRGLPSVTMKKKTLPWIHGDRHYYVSLVPDAFPCNSVPSHCRDQNSLPPDPSQCNAKNGLPWVMCSGHTNTNTVFLDGARFETMVQYVIRFTLTGYLFCDENRLRIVADLIRTWFIDPDTFMKPSLKFAQGIPGVAYGKHWGCMDIHFIGRGFVDAVLLLSQIPGSEEYWTESGRVALSSWCETMLQSMVTDPEMKLEARSKSHRGIYYDLTVMSLAILAGNKDIIQTVIGEPGCGDYAWCLQGRFLVQIGYDGSLKYEMAQADSGFSVSRALLANSYLVVLSKRVGSVAGIHEEAIPRAADWAIEYDRNKKDLFDSTGAQLYGWQAYRLLAGVTGNMSYEAMSCELMSKLSLGSEVFFLDEWEGLDAMQISTMLELDRPCRLWDLHNTGLLQGTPMLNSSCTSAQICLDCGKQKTKLAFSFIQSTTFAIVCLSLLVMSLISIKPCLLKVKKCRKERGEKRSSHDGTLLASWLHADSKLA